MIFASWRFSGTAFLAVRNGDGYSICDIHGSYYGAWRDFEEFRRRQSSGDNITPIGAVASISVRTRHDI